MGASSLAIAVSDFNNDGKSDLVVANEYAENDAYTGSISILLGNGDGTFNHR